MAEEDGLKTLIRMVLQNKLILNDDPQQLIDKSDLIDALKSNRCGQAEINELFRKGLILPVDEDGKMYHVGITFNFLSFQKKLEVISLSLRLQQKIAEMYYSIFWALVGDTEHELAEYKMEIGHTPSKAEHGYFRVINEWAVSNTMTRIEERVIKLEAEGNQELEKMIEEEARKKRSIIRKATFGYQENQIKRLIKEVWRLPLVFYQGREIKAFIDKNSIACNNDERKLLWGGHFDFSLCDNNGKLQCAIEYNGAGHYGNSAEVEQQVLAHDAAKRGICSKAGVPLIMLTAEFALLENHKKIFRKFLTLFKEKREHIDLIVLHDLIAEPFNSSDTKLISMVINKMGRVGIDNIMARLKVYRIQGRKDLLLALLWESYTTLGDFSGLDSCLDILTNSRDLPNPPLN